MEALARPVTAAIRAGYAWSVRREQGQAWLEVAKMTGVIMRHLGPGHGPVTPAELIALLHTPLGDWLPVADPALAELVVLDPTDRLTPGTYDIGCDYTVELLAGQEDPGRQWLPRWRTHRAEQVENEVFQRLVSGTDEDYTVGRRFLVENPAGQQGEIWRRRIALGIPPTADYVQIPQDQQWREWWWPCPACAWPMAVTSSGRVACRFQPHRAAYTPLNRAGHKPRLQPEPGAPRAGEARPVSGAVCVEESIWRHIVVPGVVEIRLRDRLDALPGLSAELYPGKDRFDIAVRRMAEPTWLYTLDVKDYASPSALAARLRERPVAAEHLVVPDYRRSQVTQLRRLLPGTSIATETQIYRRILKEQA
jgi:hypothetical protein